MRFIVLVLLLPLCGCLAYGSAFVQREGMVAEATYFRLGDQKLQDFYLSYDKNGTAELGLGQQEADASELRQVLLRALGVTQ